MNQYQPYWIAFCKAKNIPLDNTCKMLNFIEWMEDKYHEFELINHVKKPYGIYGHYINDLRFLGYELKMNGIYHLNIVSR